MADPDDYENIHRLANIVLDYKVKVIVGHVVEEQQVFNARSCEVFLDEHNIQWVKFVPTNGYLIGQEHMVRTDRVLIVRAEGK